MPQYHVERGGLSIPCNVKITDTEEGLKTYTFFVDDPENSVLQIQKAKDGAWMHPANKNYNLNWIDQLAQQVDSGNYY